jgi:hypothetical protein
MMVRNMNNRPKPPPAKPAGAQQEAGAQPQGTAAVPEVQFLPTLPSPAVAAPTAAKPATPAPIVPAPIPATGNPAGKKK